VRSGTRDSTDAERCFVDCSLSERLLYTSFLLLMGIGYLMALVYLYTQHEWHDKKPGLSIEDVVDTYYGNRSGTKLEGAIRGPMASFIDASDRHVVVAWLQSGAPEKAYRTTIRPILAKTCLKCHTPASGLKVPDLSNYAGVRRVAEVDVGESIHTLMKISHIHLFGIGLVALGIGLIFRLAELPRWLKGSLMVLPFAAILADILAWFLTKWDPVYAYTVVIAGAILGAAWGAQILVSLYQLWFGRASKPPGMRQVATGPRGPVAANEP